MASLPEINHSTNPFASGGQTNDTCYAPQSVLLTGHTRPVSFLASRDVGQPAKKLRRHKKKPSPHTDAAEQDHPSCDHCPALSQGVDLPDVSESKTPQLGETMVNYVPTKSEIYKRVAMVDLPRSLNRTEDFIRLKNGTVLPKVKVDTLSETATQWEQGNRIPKASERGLGNRQKFQLKNENGEFLDSETNEWVKGSAEPWEFIAGTSCTAKLTKSTKKPGLAGSTEVVLRYEAGAVTVSVANSAPQRVCLCIHPQRAALTRVLSDNAKKLEIFYFQDSEGTGFVLHLAPLRGLLSGRKCDIDQLVEEVRTLLQATSPPVTVLDTSPLREYLTFIKPLFCWADEVETGGICNFEDLSWIL